MPDPTLHWVEDASHFLAGVDPPREYLVNELVPAGAVVLLHGEPRARKSWLAIDIAVAGALGQSVVGLPRFSVEQPFRVLYSSQEDARRDVRARAKRFIVGHNAVVNGDDPTHGNLLFAVHQGILLENKTWQAAILRDIAAMNVRMLILDPIRRYSQNVDKGPAEVWAVTSFLRKIVAETGCTVLIVHHDVKPPQQQRSDSPERRRSHKASGGDWFAASECPIACEPAGRRQTLVVPEDYKLSEDPSPFLFSIEEDAHLSTCGQACTTHKTWARLHGEIAPDDDLQGLVQKERILEFLRHTPMAPASRVAAGVRVARDRTLEILERLEQEGNVDSIEKGRSTTWVLRGAPVRSRSLPGSDGGLPYTDDDD